MLDSMHLRSCAAIFLINYGWITSGQELRAKAIIFEAQSLKEAEATPGEGNIKRLGVLYFSQDRFKDEVYIKGRIHGLSPGKIGIAIHELGDLSNGCECTKDHYDPTDATSGVQTINYPYIETYPGSDIADLRIWDGLITLKGRNSVIGRSVVIFEQPFDLGTGEKVDSVKKGNAGEKVGCGVIAIKSQGFQQC